jgi:hypothetical protein
MGNGSELEALLRPPAMEMPQCPPKVITLASGEQMVVRQIDREEVPILLEAIAPHLGRAGLLRHRGGAAVC